MTRSEREALIERLQAANVDSTVEIERRAAAREADPFSASEMMLADARDTHASGDLHYTDPADGGGSPPVSENDDRGILYRRYDNRALYDGPDDGDGGGELMQALDRFADATTKALDDDARKLAELRAENVEVKGLLADALAKVGKLEGRLDEADTKLRNMAADVDAERKDHLARMSAFKVELAELRGRVSAVLRDWTT